MKKLFVIIILSIIFIISGENECEQYKNSREECESVHQNDVICIYYTYNEGSGDEEKLVNKCNQIINKDVCQYDVNKHNCLIKPGEEEPDEQACQMTAGDNEGEENCQLGTASCYHKFYSRDKCLLLENCGYDEKKDEYNRCFIIHSEKNEEGCEFKDNKCTSNSNQKFCYLVDEDGYTFCRARNIQCSDFDQDSSSCPTADLQDSTKKCS